MYLKVTLENVGDRAGRYCRKMAGSLAGHRNACTCVESWPQRSLRCCLRGVDMLWCPGRFCLEVPKGWMNSFFFLDFQWFLTFTELDDGNTTFEKEKFAGKNQGFPESNPGFQWFSTSPFSTERPNGDVDCPGSIPTGSSSRRAPTTPICPMIPVGLCTASRKSSKAMSSNLNWWIPHDKVEDDPALLRWHCPHLW